MSSKKEKKEKRRSKKQKNEDNGITIDTNNHLISQSLSINGEVQINVMDIDDTKKTGPIISNFVDGPPVNPFVENKLKFTVHEKNCMDTPRVLSASTNKIKYSSLPVNQDEQNLSKYYIGIYNKDKSNIILLNMEKFNNIFEMQQKTTSKLINENLNDEKKKSLNDLYNTFGTGKMKRAITKRKNDEITEDKVERGVIDDNVENINLDEEKLYQSTTLVPCNYKGEFPQQIYNLDLIIAKDNCLADIKDMSKEVIEALKNKDTKIDEYFGSPFFKALSKKVADNEQSKKKTKGIHLHLFVVFGPSLQGFHQENRQQKS
eukprot:TRINITY_DN7454_c0_g1_i1.p1 TRINITY_DN7454_c0_g1~~TRINITY_DN7454_c0_g1_i1.p1  ORF type:complete len:318 (+),score=96.24 TRINITY_DN7454_c0_g1_i1:88-1041(+)